MSSSTTTSLPTIALFGGTAGTGLAFLKLALAAGYQINILARTPSKLSSLSSQYPNLHIIQGDIRSIAALKACLVINNRLVDVVVSSIGMALVRKGLGFTSEDQHICEEGTKCILQALGEVEAEGKVTKSVNGPKFAVLSTTGISEKARDIPIAMVPFYHWVLHVPHADKKKMEEALKASGRRFVAVRPSFLIDGEPKGLEHVRTSTEGGEKDGETAIGYVIKRDDVARWVFEECVRGGEQKWNKWEGKMVTLTY
jgi:hypothetical protein